MDSKAAGEAAMDVPLPERNSIPSGESSVWADVSPLLDAACRGCSPKVSLFFSLIYFSAFLCLVAEKTNEEKKLKGKFLRKLVEFDLVLEIPNKKKFCVNDQRFYMGLSHLNS